MTLRHRQRVVVLAGLCAVLLSGCAVKSSVHAYAEPGADLRGFRAYAWAATEPTATGDPRLDSNEIFQDQVQAAVDRQLAARGFEKTAAGASELLVHYHASVAQRIDLSEREPFTPCRDCKPFIYDAGTLVIDLVETRTGKVLWRGWAEGNVDAVVANQRWMDERIERDVTRIFERLPR